MPAVRELERNQWLSPSEVYEKQQKKLASLLSYAYKNVPYYRSLIHDAEFDGKNSVAATDLTKIPPLTKEIVRHMKDQMISEDLTGNELRENSTSGSTGEALNFYTDRRSKVYRKAAELRSDSFTGWRYGDKVVRLWGASIDASVAQSMRGRLHGWVTGSRFLSSFDLSEKTMDSYVRTIRDYKPALLISYPGPLEQFAIHCRDRGVGFPSIKAIVSSAETLWPHQRETVEAVFGVKIFNRYGAREFGQIGSECEVHNGLHVSADRLLLEIVDDEYRQCPVGKSGKILITDLDNYGMPMIRYEIGDSGVVPTDVTCDCGRGLPLIETVEGRTLDVVRTPNGRRVGGTFWTLLLRSRPGFRQFQVVQKSRDKVEIWFIRNNDFDASVLDYFTDVILEQCGRDFRVEFVETESIDLTGSGKQRIVISLPDGG
jgi:phenylacetate-CoA ligase